VGLLQQILGIDLSGVDMISVKRLAASAIRSVVYLLSRGAR